MNTREPFVVSYRPPPAERSLAGEVYPVAVIVCAIGFFLRILLSGPVLNIIGIPYGSEDAPTIGKIHPGTYFIIASLLVLILSRGNPLDGLLRVARRQTAFFIFLAIYVLIIFYWALRNPEGIGVLIDTHIVIPICAIVFSYATLRQCRMIVYSYAGIAIVNSVIGIFESLTHIRIFPFDPSWEVLQQDYFRASALLGHPLTNACFTAVSLFIVMGLRLRPGLKAFAFVVMLVSLVGFGSRSALGFAAMGLVVLGLIGIRKSFLSKNMTVMRLMLIVLGVMLIPALCVALIYAAMHSEMGARLMAYDSLHDESATARLVALHVIDFMSPHDLLFGMSSDQITAISSQEGLANPADIENPWILMFMFLGIFMFTLWFLGLAGFVWRLMAGSSPALQLAIIEYFCIASTSNSFARKDPILIFLGGIVVCVNRLQKLENINHRETRP
ncbi:MAG: VpsF family polysaccharide biosynthesis protein [Alphaproteobacteria bacterium]|nr:VpsF family polysaccharide biosynthesis protein [Alphaproteobacteria bacterium]